MKSSEHIQYKRIGCLPPELGHGVPDNQKTRQMTKQMMFPMAGFLFPEIWIIPVKPQCVYLGHAAIRQPEIGYRETCRSTTIRGGLRMIKSTNIWSYRKKRNGFKAAK